ncbi:MAG: PAQR family membrane homeostasis protein TrhA, partial [Methyloceanibacter sp.]
MADGCIHAVGIASSLIALGVLLVIGVQSQMTLWVASLAIYGLALVAMFSCSAGYNLIMHPPKLKEVFRRLDHAAIFLMIAGTYTPFVLIKMNNAWGLGLLAVVWTIAAIGILIKLVVPRFLEGATVGLYLVQGWAIVAAWHPLVTAVPAWVAIMLGIGGLIYTIGVVFHLWERLPYQNAIW